MTWRLPSGGLWLRASRSGEGYLLEFPGLARFRVAADGCDVWCHPLLGTSAETARHLFLDQVLPLVLNLRGREALHATAVLAPGGVCAFAGAAGTGKSTLAASFLEAGHTLVSDDCLALTEEDGHVLAWPAYPGLRLWDDALEALGVGRAATAPVAAYTPKRRITGRIAVPRFAEAPHPLARVYVLARGGAAAPSPPRVERLSGSEALMALVESAFRLDIEDRAMLRRQLDFLGRVADRVPVARLHVPTDFGALPAVREAVLADLARS